MASSPILLTGATGRIGAHVVGELTRRAYRIRALCLPGDRRVGRLRRLGVEVIEGDLRDLRTVRRASAGVGGIVHLGAALTTRGAHADDIHSTIASGTFNLVQSLRDDGARDVRFVFASSTSVYLDVSVPTPLDPVDERLPARPSTVYGAAKRGAEITVEAARREGVVSAAIVRPCDTADPVELLEPTSVFGRRWFVSAAVDHAAEEPIGVPGRLDGTAVGRLRRSHDARLFTLRDVDCTEPLVQICDAQSVGVRLVDLLEVRDEILCNIVPRSHWRLRELVEAVARATVDDASGIVELDMEGAARRTFHTSRHAWGVVDAVTVPPMVEECPSAN